jgi:hypothetical protein
MSQARARCFALHKARHEEGSGSSGVHSRASELAANVLASRRRRVRKPWGAGADSEHLTRSLGTGHVAHAAGERAASIRSSSSRPASPSPQPRCLTGAPSPNLRLVRETGALPSLPSPPLLPRRRRLPSTSSGRRLSAPSANQHLSAISQWLEWLSPSGVLRSNPAASSVAHDSLTRRTRRRARSRRTEPALRFLERPDGLIPGRDRAILAS